MARFFILTCRFFIPIYYAEPWHKNLPSKRRMIKFGFPKLRNGFPPTTHHPSLEGGNMERYIVTCQEIETGRTFEKKIDSYAELRKFIIRCNHSKRIKIISYIDTYGGIMNEYE